MNKPVGGRGHKAPYQTMVMRIPVDCRQQIDDFVMRYRENFENNQIVNNESSKIFKIAAIIEEYKKTAKTSRDWTKCNQLIQEIEQQIAEHE